MEEAHGADREGTRGRRWHCFAASGGARKVIGEAVLASGPALEAARARIAAAPAEPAPWFALCRLLLERGDPSVSSLLPRLEASPRFAPGWCDLGATLLGAGKAAAAVLAFDRAPAADPMLLPAFLGRSAALLAGGDTVAAVRSAADAERIAPQSAAARFRHSLALLAAGAPQAAEAALAQAVALDAAHAEAWFSLGALRGDRGDHAGAVAAYRACLVASPGLHEPAFNLGVAPTETAALEAALDAFARAWQLRPASIGRIAQALVSAPCGCLFLDPAALRRDLVARAAGAA